MDPAVPVAFLAVAEMVGVTAMFFPRRASLILDPDDARELQAIAHDLLAEHRAEVRPLLAHRLNTITGRGVPASSVEPTGIRGQLVLAFADATRLVVRERRPGDMAVLALRLMSGRVTLASYRFSDAGALLELRWRGGRVRALAIA